MRRFLMYIYCGIHVYVKDTCIFDIITYYNMAVKKSKILGKRSLVRLEVLLYDRIYVGKDLVKFW